MEQHVLVLTVLALLLGGALGWLLGRRGNRAVERARKLQAELEASRTELESYRQRAVEHFSRTAELMRELTVRYRDVYRQLAEGARTLCPDGTPSLGRGLEETLLEKGGTSSAEASPASEGPKDSEAAPEERERDAATP